MSKSQERVIRAVRLGSGNTGRIIGQSLKNLRELSGITQIEMANRLNVGQASISKIEHRGDVHIQSLQRYVEALGATLRIEAAFSTENEIVTQFDFHSDLALSDENQLVFPLFEDETFQRNRDVVLSIHPHYTAMIMEGKKTIELRRRFPLSAAKGTVAYIYSTSPVRALVGSAEIAEVVKLPIEKIWKGYSKRALINREDFDSYFNGVNEGFALHFANPRAFDRSLSLDELRDRFGFEPPQSFLYATPILRKALADEFPNVSN